MQDAACLERARLNGDQLLVYQQKTGTPVCCPLPPSVVEKLRGPKNSSAQYFFYDGVSQPESMVKSWDRVAQKVFETPYLASIAPYAATVSDMKPLRQALRNIPVTARTPARNSSLYWVD